MLNLRAWDLRGYWGLPWGSTGRWEGRNSPTSTILCRELKSNNKSTTSQSALYDLITVLWRFFAISVMKPSSLTILTSPPIPPCPGEQGRRSQEPFSLSTMPGPPCRVALKSQLPSMALHAAPCGLCTSLLTNDNFPPLLSNNFTRMNCLSSCKPGHHTEPGAQRGDLKLKV